MRDILEHVTQWYRSGERFALATVVNTFRSAPRQPGAAMAVSADGEAVGSISGGCVEAAVYELARDGIATGHPAVQRYGVTDDDAFAVGLTCGGIIDVLLQPVDATSFPDGQIARLHSPIGLDLGASTPEETAVSIAAELIASRTSGSGRPLRGLSGPIHHRELSTNATPVP